MSLINTGMNLALTLALTVLATAACNNQKAELTEEEDATESTEDTELNRDNRNSESGDAAFIKIFPDGEVPPAQGESATVNAPASTDPNVTTQTASPELAIPSPASEIPTIVPGEAASQAPATPVTPAPPAPDETTNPGQVPGAAETLPTVPPSSAEETTVAGEVSSPAAGTQTAAAPAANDEFDHSRPVLAVNEATASQIISVQPKDNKAVLTIGKHSDFSPGPYLIMAKWSNDSKKVKVNVSEGSKDKNCAIDESATQGEWKTLGVFYLTKKARVVITNGKNKSYSVKNELLLKPVVAENLNKPSKFKCLGGQIKGQGLVEFQ